MPSQRQIDRYRSGAGHSDIGLWHLGAGLLAVGGVLGGVVGLPPSPWPVITTLMRSAQFGVVPEGTTAFNAPSMTDLEVFFRSPSTTQLDAVAGMLSWTAWLLWLWLLGTTLLRIVVVLSDRATACPGWAARLREVSDRITLSLVRQAVDATLAGEILLRSVAPAATMPPHVEYALVQAADVRESPPRSYVTDVQDLTMAPDLQPGDVLYTVQPGDNLSAIAERFYGDPAAFKRILEANLGREQRSGQTLRDARFIYPGWQLVIPEPTQAVYTDSTGQRWYTVRDGDTLWDISARLLGDAQRYPELFADNKGDKLEDGHVLTNPNLIWPGLHLRLPADAAEGETVEPPLPQPQPTPAPTSEPAPTPIAAQPSGPPAAAGEPRSQAEPADNAQAEPTPVLVPWVAQAPGDGAANPGEDTPDHWPVWVPDGAGTGLAVAGGLAAAALLAVGARRRRRTPPEPESDTRIDAHAFTVAEPAAVGASRTAGIPSDPHGVVLGELVAGELLRRARIAELSSVQVVSVIAGRSGSTVTLSSSLADRPLLEAALGTETQLARRVDISRSLDQDVVVRLQGVRQEALARMSVQDCPVLLCLGMLPDSRSYLAGWQALGHVLAASQPATTDAEEHLAALVATLAGQLAPSELHLYTLAGLAGP